MIRISVRADVRGLQRTLDDFARRQVPYAAARALTGTGRQVAAGQRELLRSKLKDPTPFTLNSIRVRGATKADLRAVVFVQDIAAAYLEPFEFGGMHKLIGKGITWLNPKHVSLNAYGNIPFGTLRRLIGGKDRKGNWKSGRGDVFVGPVKTKSGIVNGIWQRGKVVRGQRRMGRYGAKGRIDKNTGTLTLLIRFGDEIPVRQKLGWFDNAERIIRREFPRNMRLELDKAIASAKR